MPHLPVAFASADSRTKPLRERLHLVEANCAILPLVLAKAGGDPSGAVVVLADVRDPVGHGLATAAVKKAGGLDLGREAARTEARGDIPTAVIVVPLLAARMLFAETHPTVAKGLLTEPPPGKVRVVAIAAGGAVLVHAVIDATPVVGVA